MARALFADTIDHALAERVRKDNDWARPQPLGLSPSIGMGDRVGVAGPGHIRAMRAHAPAGVVAALAQQSPREMLRTKATFRQVIDAATLAVYREGYTAPWGADADHIKTPGEAKAAAAAGFTFFTVDPSDYVNERVREMEGGLLDEAIEEALLDEPVEVRERLEAEGFEKRVADVLGDVDPEDRKRAIVMFSRAISHTVTLYRLIKKRYRGPGEFDFEISIDEASRPTSLIAHALIARELSVRNARLTSMAIRFVGDLRSGADYIGDLSAFRAHLERHCMLAREMGPYKISVHSGTDKFAIFPILAEEYPDLVHIKTSGTSYVEASRIVARHDPDSARAIVALALERFEEEARLSGFTADLSLVPDPGDVGDACLEETYFETPEARQALHVTYGAALSNRETRRALREALHERADEYAEAISARLALHMTAFPEGLADD